MVSKNKASTKGKAEPHDSPDPVILRVGPVDYELFLFRGHLKFRGDRCHGLADMDACRLFISDAPPIRKRIATFWHELGHAILSECGCRESASTFGEEELCNIIGIGMSAMDADTIARVYKLLSNEAGRKLALPAWSEK